MNSDTPTTEPAADAGGGRSMGKVGHGDAHTFADLLDQLPVGSVQLSKCSGKRAILLGEDVLAQQVHCFQ